MRETVIKIENVSIKFPKTRVTLGTVESSLKKLIKFKPSPKDFFVALDSINLEVNEGEILGISGRNGSGKSTLLRAISGIYRPDEGIIKSKGQITLMAGLGIGFNVNLSGRENVYLYGSILGNSNEIMNGLMESIIDFSDLNGFIDQPLRTYSSGMRARLGFSIASAVEPDILLIDEVTEIPLETQSKILRVLTDQKFKRINGNHDIKVDVRIICSTSKNIHEEIKLGNFREDLFHRLNVFNINIEPLKNRIEDVSLLVEYFSEKISKNYNLKQFDLKNYINYLINYNWPGNVRELRNLIERIAILSPENSKENILNIVKESLKSTTSEVFNVNDTLLVPLKEARENFEKEYLTTQLKKFGGNISKTAKFVGMERSALHRKLKILGVKGLN